MVRDPQLDFSLPTKPTGAGDSVQDRGQEDHGRAGQHCERALPTRVSLFESAGGYACSVSSDAFLLECMAMRDLSLNVRRVFHLPSALCARHATCACPCVVHW